MDFSKFFGQIASSIRRSNERTDMNKTEPTHLETQNLPASSERQVQTIPRNLKAETTQDFKLFLSQLDYGINSESQSNGLGNSQEGPDRHRGHEINGSALRIDPGTKVNGKPTLMAGDSLNGIKATKLEGGSKETLATGAPNGTLQPTTIKIRTLLPMRARKPTVIEELDQKRKEELEAQFLKQLSLKYPVKASPPKQDLNSVADLDYDEIERAINDKPSLPYKTGFFDNKPAFGNPSAPAFQNGFEASNMNSGFESSGGFFSAAGGKPITINPENLKAAQAVLFGDDDDAPDFDKKDQPGGSGFVNPFQSANSNFGAFSNPFSAPQTKMFGKPEEPGSNFEKANQGFQSFQNSDLGFNRFNENSSGPISFTTGNMSAPVKINQEHLLKAMALLADDKDDEPEPVLGPDENARMGPPQTRGNASPAKAPAHAIQPNPTKFVVNNKPIKPNGALGKVVSPDPEKLADDAENHQGPNAEEYSLRAAITKASKEQPPVVNGQKPKKDPFMQEPAKKPKMKFEVPHQTKVGFNPPKLNLAINKPMTKVKTALSKFHNVATIDNDRITKMMSTLKKKTKLHGYKEKRVSKNYGHQFLTMAEIYEHLRTELDELNIKGVDEFLDQLIIELRHQLSKTDVDIGWVEHHLKMLSRKYYHRVKSEGASSSSCLPKTASVIPYKVDVKNILTDMYYRHRKEEFMQKLSVLRMMNEGLFQVDQRVCLMVTAINNPTKERYTIEFTDGWYLAYMELYSNQEKQLALLDSKECHQEFNNNLILRLILKGLLKPGDKIEVSHIKLDRQENQPVYKPTKIEIFYNAMRRLPWNTQMGLLYTKIKPTKLKDIKPCGGIVPMIDVLILEKRGIKIGNPERDEFMIKVQYSDNDRLSINFSLIVVDSIHMDPQYTAPVSLHMVTFRGVDPGKYLDISVGQRLQIYGVKMGKSKQYSVTQSNFMQQLPWGLHFSENRRNSSTVLDIPIKLRNEAYAKVMDLRRRDFLPLDDMKDALLKVMNMPKTEVGDFLMSAAVKYVKHSGNLCLFHFYEKHFVQVELRMGPTGKPVNSKDDPKGGQQQTPFWERVMRDLCAISESNCELLLFYDLNYLCQSKVVELKSRGKIYIHKFGFDVINDYMLGENFIISNIENNSIERYLISEYKKNKNLKLADNDTISQLICDMSKYPLT